MTRDDLRVRKTAVTLADGRALMYFGAVPERPGDYPDLRQLAAVHVQSQARWDQLLGEWVIIASHRQDRTFQPAAGQCPLCPSSAGSLTEIPDPDYEVVVFENRFPTLRAQGTDTDDGDHGNGAGRQPAAAAASGSPPVISQGNLLAGRPAGGRCEVVCFSPHHAASFADLSPGQAAIVMAAWADRSAELAQQPGVEQVYCFEDRGDEIGVTLSHPHGQIYAYPYVTPRTDRMLQSCASYRSRTSRNLFDDILAAEHADSSRIVFQGSHWTAFVPYAAHWPYEVHLYPRPRVPDLAALADAARAEFCELYLDLLRRLDRLFDSPAPYISAWHQAPVRRGRDDFALHLELLTIRLAPGKLKYLAGSGIGHGRVRQRRRSRGGGQAPARTRLTLCPAISAACWRGGDGCGDHGPRRPPCLPSP
jgi:UDPglucose--hexose-1-phosphate uridylyltransferase